MTTTLDADPVIDEPIATDSIVEPLDDVALDPCLCPETHDTIDGACDLFLPVGHGNRRKRCDGCQTAGGWIHKKAKGTKDAPPINVTVKMPGVPKTKGDAEQQRVTEAANAWIQMLAMCMEVAGDATCAQAIKAQAPQIALQLGVLNKYHPKIGQILAPLEATGEGLAWMSLGIAVFPILTVVLVHHHLVSEETAQRLAVIAALGPVLAQQQAEAANAQQQEAAEPKAA